MRCKLWNDECSTQILPAIADIRLFARRRRIFIFVLSYRIHRIASHRIEACKSVTKRMNLKTDFLSLSLSISMIGHSHGHSFNRTHHRVYEQHIHMYVDCRCHQCTILSLFSVVVVSAWASLSPQMSGLPMLRSLLLGWSHHTLNNTNANYTFLYVIID